MTQESAPGAITAMPLDLPEGAAKPFDAPGLARRLMRSVGAASLATNDPASGFPLATLVTVASDADGAPVLFLSGLSLHTRNLLADPRAALLLARTGKGDPLAHPRLTLVGEVAPDDRPRLKQRFLARHPKAELYAALPDFRTFRMDVRGVHLNGGFARAAPLKPEDVLVDVGGADALIAAEPDALSHLNDDHADALALYAEHLAGAGPGAWRAIAIDPEGLDLALGDLFARIMFPAPVKTPGELAGTLKVLAGSARAKIS